MFLKFILPGFLSLPCKFGIGHCSIGPGPIATGTCFRFLEWHVAIMNGDVLQVQVGMIFNHVLDHFSVVGTGRTREEGQGSAGDLDDRSSIWLCPLGSGDEEHSAGIRGVVAAVLAVLKECVMVKPRPTSLSSVDVHTFQSPVAHK
ncbi:hypothetical protein PAXINDRAFT_155320 [Paxillus involutus ATCC 200175]|uniref:Uncharacterized protein n=1 Tax=Paxillus involutus ATCC 200175 TaxID=664439 RepID=A0A0C9U8L3_PAXIN|nr:hypothetical protein PAXINDRAFT_155320 [Paxillus involutus ATCC 200175]